MIGEQIDRYQIVRVLGEGGMGAVYEARHSGTGRTVALKTIHPERLKSPQLLKRFEIEARAAGAIESEHVVQLFDVGVDERKRIPYLAMELVSGEDLSKVLDRYGRLPPDLALRIGVQLCLGLEKAHARGILHRDIKPQNLILAERDGGQRRVKIVDFGLAKVFEDDPNDPAPKVTVTGMLLGSPQYMSPEQARASKQLDVRTDIWSAGMVLYELVTGRTAFEDIKTLPKVIDAITTRPVPPIRSFLPEVELGISTAIERALELDPARRYASAKEMREALAAFLPSGHALEASQFERLTPQKPAGAPAAPNDALTVAGAAAQPAPPPREATVPDVPLAPLAGAARVPPTRPSDSPDPASPAAPQREPQVVPVATSRGGVASGAAAPRREQTLMSSDAALGAGAAAQPAVTPKPAPQTQPAAKPAGSKLPLVAGAAVLITGALGGAGWYLSQRTSGGPAASGASASAAGPTAEPAGSSTAKAAAAASPVGKWKSESGRLYDAVQVGEKFELRVLGGPGFERTGYQVGEVRFTLTPTAIAGEYEVEDRVRPALVPGKSYDDKARASCLAVFKAAGGKPLRAKLQGGELVIDAAVIFPTAAMLSYAGDKLASCKGLESSPAEAQAALLKRP